MDFFDAIISAVDSDRLRKFSSEIDISTWEEFVSTPKPAGPKGSKNSGVENKTSSNTTMNNSAEEMTAQSPLPRASAKPRRPSIDKEEITSCQRCRLAARRNKVVPGAGKENALLMFIGEAPGLEEDKQGIPFVGSAGELLNRMLKAMKFSREEVFLSTLVKCRPPYNRTAQDDEISSCIGFLTAEIDRIKPKMLVLFGDTVLRALLNGDKVENFRHKWFQYRNIPCIVTYSPAFLLRNEEAKRATWEDLKMVMAAFGKQ